MPTKVSKHQSLLLEAQERGDRNISLIALRLLSQEIEADKEAAERKRSNAAFKLLLGKKLQNHIDNLSNVQKDLVYTKTAISKEGNDAIDAIGGFINDFEANLNENGYGLYISVLKSHLRKETERTMPQVIDHQDSGGR